MLIRARGGAQVARLQELFHEYDADGAGTIDAAEFRAALESLHVRPYLPVQGAARGNLCWRHRVQEPAPLSVGAFTA